jgi:hypothetical protein
MGGCRLGLAAPNRGNWIRRLTRHISNRGDETPTSATRRWPGIGG